MVWVGVGRAAASMARMRPVWAPVLASTNVAETQKVWEEEEEEEEDMGELNGSLFTSV